MLRTRVPDVVMVRVLALCFTFGLVAGMMQGIR